MNEDICANKHGGNEESEAAFIRTRDSLLIMRGRILTMIAKRPRTMKEIANELGVQLNTISGRASELKKMKLIETTGERRDGAAVLTLR